MTIDVLRQHLISIVVAVRTTSLWTASRVTRTDRLKRRLDHVTFSTQDGADDVIIRRRISRRQTKSTAPRAQQMSRRRGKIW